MLLSWLYCTLFFGIGIMSIIQSARLNGLDVSAYLTDVLRRLPIQDDLDELLPHLWVPSQ